MNDNQNLNQPNLTSAQQQMLDVDARIAEERRVQQMYATGEQSLLNGSQNIPLSTFSKGSKKRSVRYILLSACIILLLGGVSYAFSGLSPDPVSSDDSTALTTEKKQPDEMPTINTPENNPESNETIETEPAEPI